MFPIDTPIALAGGEHKPIRMLVEGDPILSSDGGQDAVAKVLFERYEGDMIAVDYQDNGSVRATPGQLFLTDRGWQPAAYIVVGDRLVAPDAGPDGHVRLEVEATHRVACDTIVGFLSTNMGNNYLASGVAVAQGRWA